MHNHIAKLTLALAALFAAASVNADVTLSINDPNGGSVNGIANDAFCSYSGLNASLTVNGTTEHDINGGEWIGIYSFSVGPNPNPTVTSPYYSICLSPGGNLTDGSYTYKQMTPPAAGSEINPGSWTASGFNNAAYLFSKYQPAITAGTANSSFKLVGSTADQGTALAMAIYSALWNSTGSGVANGTANSGFYITGFGNGNVSTDYTDMLTALDAAILGKTVGTTADTVLVPNNSGASGPSGQEFILLGVQPQGGPVVPEASTIISGLLLLLPFGAGLVRIMRKKAV